MISKEQKKVLKRLKKKPIAYKDLDHSYPELYGHLVSQGLATYRQSSDPDGEDPLSLNISPAGVAALEDRSDSKIRLWVPIAISVIALVSSFRNELLLLLQVLASVLRP